MKKLAIAVLLFVFLFGITNIECFIYTSPTGSWYGPGGKTVGKGRHGGHTVNVGTEGIESVTVYCSRETEWTCWTINGSELTIDPVVTGPGDRIDMIFTN